MASTMANVVPGTPPDPNASPTVTTQVSTQATQTSTTATSLPLQPLASPTAQLNVVATPPASPPLNSTIQALLDLAAARHQPLPPDPMPSLIPKVSHAYSKLPDIMTAAIKPLYSGTVAGFFTFLFQIRECCSICHFWAQATCFNDIDLLTHFSIINPDHTLSQLVTRWTSSFQSRIYEPGSPACAAQLFYQVLTTSVQVNIQCKVAQCLQPFPSLDGDGTAFWICLTSIIFPNTQIFTSSIKTQIRQLTLQACTDIADYITQVTDLIQLLGPYPTDELLPDLFRQFKSVPRHYFHKAISDIEQDYYLGRLPDLNCLSLCVTVTKIKRIQEQAQQWDTPSPDEPSILALRATISQQNQTLLAQQQALEAFMAQPSDSQSSSTVRRGFDTRNHNRYTPIWVRDKPTDPYATRQHNDRTWYFCSKCLHGTGAWNTTHYTDSHIDNFKSRGPSVIDHSPPSHGLQRTHSADSNDSRQNRRRPGVSFADDHPNKHVKRSPQPQPKPSHNSAIIDSLKAARVSLLSCIKNSSSVDANTFNNSGQSTGNGN